MPTEFPYLTILETRYKPLEIIEEKLTSDAAPHPWYNETLCNVNDSVVRLGVVQGNYHWHNHQREDEFFYVVEGRLLIDLIDPQDPATTEDNPAQSTSVLVRESSFPKASFTAPARLSVQSC